MKKNLLITLAFLCLLFEGLTLLGLSFGMPVLLTTIYSDLAQVPTDLFTPMRAFIAMFGLLIGGALAIEVCYSWWRNDKNLRGLWLRLVDALYMWSHNTTRSKLRPFGSWVVVLLLAGAGLVSSCGRANAQTSDQDPERENPELVLKRLHYRSAMALTRVMQQELHMNEGEFVRVLTLNREYFRQLSMLPAQDHHLREQLSEQHAKQIIWTLRGRRYKLEGMARLRQAVYVVETVQDYSVL